MPDATICIMNRVFIKSHDYPGNDWDLVNKLSYCPSTDLGLRFACPSWNVRRILKHLSKTESLILLQQEHAREIVSSW